MRGIVEEPKGLVYRSEFINEDEEKALLAWFAGLEFHQVVMHGQAAWRVTRHFGYSYNYQNFETRRSEPIPPQLVLLRQRAEELAGLQEGDLVEALITRYPRGAPIGWHRDAGTFGIIVGVSLLAPCIMQFQRREGESRFVYERILNLRSAYIMRGEARHRWQHHIPPTKVERYSVTFRTLNK